MQLRDYQQEAIDCVFKSFKKGNSFTLVKAPTGAGKTILMAELVSRSLKEYKINALVLMHRTVLVEQTIETFNRFGIGACSARKIKGKIEGTVVVGTIQTVARRDVSKFNLVIIDECHRVAGKETKSQYGDVLRELLKLNERVRVLGLTATPFRLNDGYIFGHARDWFKELSYDIEMNLLIEKGYLVPMKYFIESGLDLSKIKKTAGEYNERELGEEMSKEYHLGSVKHAIEAKAEGRTHIAVFCVTIEHAEAMADVLGGMALHSNMSKLNRANTLRRFKDEGGVLCSVGALTEGWDEPQCDCVVLARPTLSPALYVQMLGRGLRLHEGKKDCLIVDMVGLYNRHGHPNDPEVKEKGEGGEATEGMRRAEICPECGCLLRDGDRVCPECGCNVSEYNSRDGVEYLGKPVKLTQVDLEQKKMKLIGVTAKPFVSKAGNRCIIINYFCEGLPEPVPQFYSVRHSMALRKLDKALKEMYGLETKNFNCEQKLSEYIKAHPNVDARVRIEKDGKYKKVKFV
jgi:DNA repair protein RadD